MRAFVHTALEREGYRVLVAENSVAGVEMANAETGPIHLLLTDVVMPRMSGRSLAEILVAQRRDLKVLFMSGYSEHAIVSQGAVRGAVHFVAKPLELLTLLSKVRAVLEASHDA